MALDDTPNKLESAFIQRNSGNQYYEQLNVSGSDLIVYHNSAGILTADKVSVFAAAYGLSGSGGGTTGLGTGSTYPFTSSWALNTPSANSSSYALSASYTITASYTFSSSYAGSADSMSVFYTGSNTNYFIPFVFFTGSQPFYIDTASIKYNPGTDVLTVTYVSASSVTASLHGTASWAVSSSFGLSSSYALSSSYSNTASFAVSASWAPTVPGTLGTGSTYPFTASWALSASSVISASYALTASDAEGVIVFISSGITPNYYMYWVAAPSGSQQFVPSATSNILDGATSASLFGTSSWAISASWAPGGGGSSLGTGSTYPFTASWSNNSVSSSYAITSSFTNSSSISVSSSYALSASYAPGTPGTLGTGSTYPFTASWALSSSTAISASWAPGSGGSSLGTGSTYPFTASWATNALSVSVAYTGSNTNFYIPFVAFTGSQPFYIDTGSILYSPGLDLLTVNNISASRVTASLYGTASWAATSSFLIGSVTSASFSSLAVSASYVLGSGVDGQVNSASVAQTVINVTMDILQLQVFS
jgi:hypothetical protein